MVVLGRVLEFGPWPPFPRCPLRWPILWRGQWMNVSLPMCTWWRERRKRRQTSWQVWRRRGWSRGFPNMRTGKGLHKKHAFFGVLFLSLQMIVFHFWFPLCFFFQLVGTHRPKGRGSGGKQDCDCDKESEGHHPHTCWRGEEPAG